MNRLRRLLSLSAAAAVVAASGQGANLDSLLNNSPFNQPAGNAANVASEALELRGVVIEDGRASLNIYDTATKKAAWVTVDEPGHAFLVRSFDAANDTATIEVNRRTVSLPLKRATVQLAAAAPVAPPPAPVGVNLAAGTAVAGQPAGAPAANAAVNAAGAAPDQARLQAIADEIRRRRAMRAQNQGQPQPQTSAMPEGTSIPGRRPNNNAGQNQRRN